MDVCVVAISEGLEAALLTTLIAKNLGAKRALARAQTANQGDILGRIGADEIIQAEVEIGQQLADRLAPPHLEALVDLDREHGIVRVRAPLAIQDKTLNNLDLRQRHRVPLSRSSGQARTRRKGALNDVLFLVGNHMALSSVPRK